MGDMAVLLALFGALVLSGERSRGVWVQGCWGFLGHCSEVGAGVVVSVSQLSTRVSLCVLVYVHVCTYFHAQCHGFCTGILY